MNAFNRFSIGQRLLLIVITFLLPITTLFWIYYNSASSNIEFAAQEQRGNTYQKPLEQLVRFLPEYKLAALGIGKNNPQQLAGKIDQAFSDLMQVDELYRDALFSDISLEARKRQQIRADRVETRWNDLKKIPVTEETAAKIAGGAQDLFNDILTMVAHAGDTSNLILDPDLDSYYLMDITLLALPQTQNRLAEIREFTAGIFERSYLSVSEKVQLAVYAAQLQQDDRDRIINGDVPAILENDEAYYGLSQTLQANLPPAADAYAKATDKLIGQLKALCGSDDLTITSDEFGATLSSAIDSTFSLWDSSSKELDLLLENRIGSFQGSLYLGIFLTMIAVLVSMAMTFFIARSITKPVGGIIEALTNGSEQLAHTSSQIAGASQSLAEGSTSQASALEETSSALEEMSSMTAQNAENARKANETMIDTRKRVNEGAVSVQSMATAMAEINEYSEKIRNIIKTIEEIAFQTNLLALNAAVEAARAGESGKGFAVVADEVRNLAQRSAQASRDTSELIEGTVTRVGKGSSIVNEFEKSFSGIESGANRIAKLIEEITAASQEQAQGVEQVNKAISSMDSVTQNNAACAEESASASAELASQADQLHNLVGNLIRIVNGTNTNE